MLLDGLRWSERSGAAENPAGSLGPMHPISGVASCGAQSRPGGRSFRSSSAPPDLWHLEPKSLGQVSGRTTSGPARPIRSIRPGRGCTTVVVMERLDGPRIDAAERFVWLFGRLLDRRRFAYLFRAGDPEAVVAALRPYGNPDGGVGHALEPDLRGPSSQPVPAEHALRVLDEVDRFDDPLVAGVCDWLTGVSCPDGGVPFLLPTTAPEPSAPWWQAPDDPSGSLNPTAALAGLLHARGVAHPWLVPAT